MRSDAACVQEVRVKGIQNITSDMIAQAQAHGEVYKLIATAERQEDGIYLYSGCCP